VKKRKRKLVMAFGSAKKSSNIPQQYVSASFKWLCEVSAERDDGLVEEYEIEPDQKLQLNEFLTILGEKISEMIENDTADWSVKIYRV